MTDLSQSREKDKINPVVFYTSAGLILLFSLMTIFFRDFSAEWIGRTLDWVSKTFGWYYLLAATLYIVFVVCIACSRGSSRRNSYTRFDNRRRLLTCCNR